MKTEKAKKKNNPHRGNMRVYMSLLDLYDACLRNASDLLTEAKLLFSNDHIARAFALAYTGWEEVGKSQLVADFANDMAAEDEFEAAFKDHMLKSAYNRRHFAFNSDDVKDSTIRQGCTT